MYEGFLVVAVLLIFPAKLAKQTITSGRNGSPNNWYHILQAYLCLDLQIQRLRPAARYISITPPSLLSYAIVSTLLFV